MSPKIRTVDCKTGVEFLDALREISRDSTVGTRPDRWAFRGQWNAEWRLTPTAFRPGVRLTYELQIHSHDANPADVDSYEQKNAEFFTIFEFLRLADAVGLRVPGDHPIFRTNRVFTNVVGHITCGLDRWPPDDVLQLLAIAQHHGVPTRLLDFTYRWAVAAFFAAVPSREPLHSPLHDRLAVWALDIDHVYFSAEREERVRIVTVPRATNANLHAQHGFFVYDARRRRGDPVEIDQIIADHLLNGVLADQGLPPLIKITAPTSSAREILSLLELDGIDDAHLRPSFDTVVAELNRRRDANTASPGRTPGRPYD